MLSFNRLSAVKSLVYLSVLLSLLSYFTSRNGYGEIYPFYHWNISGSVNSETRGSQLRVYALDSSNVWTRIPVKKSGTFDREDIIHFLGFHSKGNTTSKMKLKSLCEYLYPGYREYRIYQETYNPKDILENPENYDTVFVTKVP